MSQERVSISMPQDLVAAIRAHADASGETVSGWATKALAERVERETRLADGLAAMAEYEQEHGAFTDAELAAAHQELVDAGAIPADHPMAS